MYGLTPEEINTIEIKFKDNPDMHSVPTYLSGELIKAGAEAQLTKLSDVLNEKLVETTARTLLRKFNNKKFEYLRNPDKTLLFKDMAREAVSQILPALRARMEKEKEDANN